MPATYAANIEDYRTWEYDADDQGPYLTVDFDPTTKTLRQIGCYSRRFANCPSLFGIHDGTSEDEVLETLGKPSREEIDGAAKKIEYERFGVWFYLEQRKVYLMGVSASGRRFN